MAYPSNIKVTMQGEKMKPHYQCTKSECVQELLQYQVVAHKDLTLQELRVLLREARKKEGIIAPREDNTIMEEIKKGKLDTLRRIVCGPGHWHQLQDHGWGDEVGSPPMADRVWHGRHHLRDWPACRGHLQRDHAQQAGLHPVRPSRRFRQPLRQTGA